jgi:L-cysteine/cystine lyase
VLIRDQLPALRGVAYLNTGTNGPMPLAVADAMREELEASVSRPRIGKEAFDRLLGGRERAREAAARVLGAKPAEIALTGSTSQGVGLVISGLDWQPGDVVLTTTEEHQGIRSPLEVIGRRAGVDVREIPADDLLAAIRPGVRMVAVSHVLWTTGRVLDVDAIVAAARDAGARVLLDGAQSAGNIAVDAPAIGADYYTLSGQKWLLGPMGSGALWLRPDRVEELWPVLSNYLGLESGEVGRMKAGAPRFDPGTIDPVTTAGFTAALEWVEAQEGGRSAWVERTRDNAMAARERLGQVPGVRVSQPQGTLNGLIAFTVDGEDCESVATRLAEANVLVRFIPGTPWVRASIGAWTDASDIDALATALER